VASDEAFLSGMVQGKEIEMVADNYKKTVADLGIRADSTLIVRLLDGKNDDDEDLDSALWEQISQEDNEMPSNYRPEQGFKGTILGQGLWRLLEAPSVVDVVDDEVVQVVKADNDTMSITLQSEPPSPPGRGVAADTPVRMEESPRTSSLPYEVELTPCDEMEVDGDSDGGDFVDLTHDDEVTMMDPHLKQQALALDKTAECTSRLSDQMAASCRSRRYYVENVEEADEPFA